MKYRLVVFDFDGTLADSFPWFASHLNQAADKFRLKKVEASEVESLRDIDVGELLKRYQVPFWKLPFVARFMRKLMTENPEGVTLFPGIEAALVRLVQAGARLAIVSSNAEKNIRPVLGPRAEALIERYVCGASMFGKASDIEKVLRKLGVKKEEAVYIGDEVRDIDAAWKAGVDCGVVSWGYNHIGILERHQPTFVFKRVEEIVSKLCV
jgi:phosphoglycolate phosphatase